MTPSNRINGHAPCSVAAKSGILSGKRRRVSRALAPLILALGCALLFTGCCRGSKYREIQTRVQGISEANLRRHVDTVTGFGARSLRQTEALRKTRQYIKTELGRWGYEPWEEEIDFPNPIPASPHFNVIAEIKGDKKPDEVVEIRAHFDSYRQVPGADDNASAVSALLEAARVMSGASCEKTIRFCFFDLEE